MACLHFQHSPSAGSWGGGEGRWPSEQRWVADVGHRNPLLLHFIRQQTHRQSGSDKDRRTASSDNHRHHSAQAEAKESREKASVALMESDDSVIKPRTKGEVMKFDRDFERKQS